MERKREGWGAIFRYKSKIYVNCCVSYFQPVYHFYMQYSAMHCNRSKSKVLC